MDDPRPALTVLNALQPFLDTYLMTEDHRVRFGFTRFLIKLSTHTDLTDRQVQLFETLLGMFSKVKNGTCEICERFADQTINENVCRQSVVTDEYFLLLKTVVHAGRLVDQVTSRAPMFCNAIKDIGKSGAPFPGPVSHCFRFLTSILTADKFDRFFQNGSYSNFIAGWSFFSWKRDCVGDVEKLLIFTPFSAFATLCKSGFFAIVLKEGFRGDDTGDSFGSYLREYIRAILHQKPEFVDPLTSVLWNSSLCQTHIAHKSAHYFRLTWQLLKLCPAASNLFHSQIFPRFIQSVRSLLFVANRQTDPALYLLSRTLAAFNLAYYSENKSVKHFFFGSKITNLIQEYKDMYFSLDELVSALGASGGTAICRLIASMARLGKGFADDLFALLKARKRAVHLDVPQRSLAWAVRMIATVCRCRREFNPKAKTEIETETSEVVTREFAALAQSPDGTFPVMQPLFAELTVTEKLVPAVVGVLAAAVDSVFERTESMEGVGPELALLLAMIGDGSKVRRWGERAAEIVAAQVRAALASEEAVDVAKAARSVGVVDGFLKVLESEKTIVGRPIRLDDRELQRFIEVMTRQSDEKIQEVCSVITQWRSMKR
jgi:hypothetical protein